MAGVHQEDAFGISESLADVSLAHLVTEHADVGLGTSGAEDESLEFGFGHRMEVSRLVLRERAFQRKKAHPGL